MSLPTINSLLTVVDACDSNSLTTVGSGQQAILDSNLDLDGGGCQAFGLADGAIGSGSPSFATFDGGDRTVSSFSGANKVLWIWARTIHRLESFANGGLSLFIRDTGGNEGVYPLSGLDVGYFGDWQCFAVSIDDSYLNSTWNNGTDPGLTVIVGVGIVFNVSGTTGLSSSYRRSCWIDNIRKTNTYDGYEFYGGTGGDPVTFAELAEQDFENGHGIFRAQEPGLFTQLGEFRVGKTSQNLYMTDSDVTIKCVDMVAVKAGIWDWTIISGGTSVFTFTDVQWIGIPGRTIVHTYTNMATGDSGTFSRCVWQDISTVKFDTLITVIDSCRFINVAGEIDGNGCPITNSYFYNIDRIEIDTTGDELRNCTIEKQDTSASQYMGYTNDLSRISDCDFDNTGGFGYCIRQSSAGTYTFTGNRFVGYGADGSTSAALYYSGSGIVNVVLGVGDQFPTFNTTHANGQMNIYVPATVGIEVFDKADAAIENARVLIIAGPGGDKAHEDTVTITRSGSTATVTHTDHGLQTSQEIKIKGANEEEYNGVFTVTRTGHDTYTYTVSGTPATPATGTIEGTYVIINGLTDSSGYIQNGGYRWTSNQYIEGFVRKGTASTYYKSQRIYGVIHEAGCSMKIELVADE